ncbi:hypothetical protein F4820DRAFT_463435 [Hypoxylon rubiginosum]|uniref:Uncharacterized protein n=1 Tax=Hypoxylon rubiginosum TaxID=110542 RepID=A0ACB9ZDQ6_9PEZI|nr:hypothetical protein F4820DRAFT_463435 [Hypoxylon rubiginosum]
MALDDRGPQLAAVTLFFLGLAALTVTLRCFVRLFILKVFQVEDWLAVASMVNKPTLPLEGGGQLFMELGANRDKASFVAYTAIVMHTISYGAGKHLAAVPVEHIPLALKSRWAAELVYVVTSMLAKFTVGLFLLRISPQAWQRTVICATLLVCLAYHVFYAFMAAFQCQPVSFFWLKHVPGAVGRCWSDELVIGCTYAAAAVNAVADWILGLLPIALVQNLGLSKRSQVLVSCTLALGSIASSATIVRIPYIWQLTQPGDFMYEFTDLAIWSTTEIGLGIVASAVATLRPLVRLVFGGSSSSSLSSPRHSYPSRSFHYSWRRSGTVAVQHRRTRSGEGPEQQQRQQGYYRMASWRKDSDGESEPKMPERVRARERRVREAN